MYRGFWAFAWRDVPGFAVYFAAYAKLKDMGNDMSQNWTCSEEQKSFRQFLWILNAGGVAGAVSWLASMPFDIIKTH